MESFLATNTHAKQTDALARKKTLKSSKVKEKLLLA
jgi:hypothetical protein